MKQRASVLYKTNRLVIIGRDYVCQLCLQPVDKTLLYVANNRHRRYCKKPECFGCVTPHPGSPTADHIIPVAQGGTDDLDNLQLAHYRCNVTRLDKSMVQVRKEQFAKVMRERRLQEQASSGVNWLTAIEGADE